jgi:uncharacterized protein (TIGR02246 family)
MRPYLSVLFVAAVATATTAARADDAAEIAAIEAQRTALGRAYADGDAAALRALMTPDQRSVAFVYDGAQTVDEQVAALKDLDVEVYDAIPPTVEFLGPAAALVTYEQSYRGTYKGNPLPGRVFVGEVWVKPDGAWLQKYYQETIIEEEQ